MAGRGRPRAFDTSIALTVAMRLFWERGYEGVSIADLTDAMGLRPPSLYAAFGSKELLFREAVEFYSVTEGASGDAAFDAAETAKDAVSALLLGTAARLTRAGQPRGCLIVTGAMNCGERNDGVAGALHDRRRQFVDRLEQRLIRGQSDGDVDANADVQAVAHYYATVANGLSLLARDDASPAQLHAVAHLALASWDVVTTPSAKLTDPQ